MLDFVSCFSDLNGFDDSNPVRWQMVPLDGERLVALLDGSSANIEISGQSFASIIEVYTNNALNKTADQQRWANTAATIANEKGWKNPRFFLLKGHSEGTAKLTAKTSITRELEVSVHSQRNLYVTFHIVQDKGGKRYSSRSESEITSMLAEVNSFFPAQTNIKFTCHFINYIELDRKLGGSVVYKYKNSDPDVTVSGDETKHIFEYVDSGVPINVFFVWDISAKGVGSAPKGTTFDPRDPIGLTYGRCILIEDKVKQNAGLVLGHELTHSLGHKDHHALQGGLMHLFTEPMGKRIYRNEAKTVYANSFK